MTAPRWTNRRIPHGASEPLDASASRSWRSLWTYHPPLESAHGPVHFGVRNGVHIIDLEQTLPLLNQALLTVRNVVAGGGRGLFVGTTRPGRDPGARPDER